MKKIKTLVITLIIVMLLIGLSSMVFGSDNRTKLTIGDKTSVDLGYNHMSNVYNNIYCIEHGQHMNEVKKYSINTKVEITGQKAEIYARNGQTKKYELKKTVTSEANNILGAILTNGNIDGKVSKKNKGGKYTYGYGSANNYTDAQLGLYRYIKTWIQATGTAAYGFEATSQGLSSSQISIGDAVINQAKVKSQEYSYRVTLYLLKNGAQAYQTLIATDPKDPTILSIPVEKKWFDNNYGTRPEITVRLLANGVDTGETLTLKADKDPAKNWKGKFENLKRTDGNGKNIVYTIQEVTVPGYETKITGSATKGFIITNTLKIDLHVKKEWNDEDDLDDLRPTTIQVRLYSNNSATDKVVTLSKDDGWAPKSFTDLPLCDANGNVIKYEVKEDVIKGYEAGYNKTIDKNGDITYTITNTHIPNYEGYIEINGNVWKDRPDGKGNDVNGVKEDDESGIEGIKVTLKDKDGKLFDATSTTNTDKNGNYTIKVNYDNSQNVYKLYEDVEKVKEKLKTSYIEFEYDAMKYTTVAIATIGADTSKAKEDEVLRNSFDTSHTTVTPSTIHPDSWTDKTITAKTKDVISFETYADRTETNTEEVIKYCNGDGTYKHTNIERAWDTIQTGKYTCTDCPKTGHVLRTYNKISIEVINNVNLGLFEREQPKVGIFSDISKVEVTMQGQKYTYLYNVRSNENNYVGLQVKFQNKNTYTYRRPVNPADIAYLNDGHEDAMTVFVTYEIKVGNLSTTLPITIHNITNYYDSRYTLTTEGWTANAGAGFNQATYNGDLKLNVEPQKESKAIELTYQVSLDAIKALLNNEATLNNAVEIQSYSTQYGEKTLYAEQRTGGRTNLAYGGYDNESHPGNSGIFVNQEGRLEAAKLEPDTDIAPSFVLYKDEEPKVLSGTVYEDTDINEEDNLRLGNGKNDSEKGIANVKVELLKVNADGTTEPAYLYYRDSSKGKILAETYTDSNGNYAFGAKAEDIQNSYGVVTDTYIIKYTYGGECNKNARNYKSTIISSETDVYNVFKGTTATDEWHLNTSKGYSIAVDDMETRVGIKDLQYNNFNDTYNMIAYTKPFKMQIEFDPSTGKTSTVSSDGKVAFGKELNIFDFGIIERAREDIFVETTVDYIDLVLANGQTLTKGNPSVDKMSYAKAIGLNQQINSSKAARKALDKQIRIEMDAELIQGAQLNVKYAIKVTNNSEKDYDYYLENEEEPFDVSKLRTEYYYFGTNNENAPEITSSVNHLVNYLDPEVTYSWENEGDWNRANAEELRDQGYISETTYNELVSQKYVIYTTSKFSNLKSGETIIDHITGKKLLANEDESVYDNHAEILKIDAKTARTIKQTDVIKEYKMGDYVPGLETRETYEDDKGTAVYVPKNDEKVGLHEQDDDRILVSITPPTGETNYIITYVVTGLVGLIAMVIAIIFIKKKVITK